MKERESLFNLMVIIARTTYFGGIVWIYLRRSK